MHHLRVAEWSGIGDDTIRSLRANRPAGGWFPALQGLYWCIASHNIPYTDLFFSPHLKKISISVSWSWSGYRPPRGILPSIASAISMLPASALQILFVDGSHREMPWAHFKDSFSSVALRCGPSLTEFTSPVSLSGAAINHLIQLPQLRVWRIEGPPPSYSTSSLTLLFPPLVEFTLGEGAAPEWLSLFKRLEDRASSTQGMTPLFRMKGSLESLTVNNSPGLTIDVSFASPIQIFRNLVDLNVLVRCHEEHNEGQCSFKLNDNNVAELAIALPRLEVLLLGHPCRENTCATTVACLFLISVHCVELRKLEIHFNTADIIDDLKDLSEDPRFQELRSLPRCTLTWLNAYQTPLTLDEPGFETVANGMVSIFPCLGCCEGVEEIWDEISEKIVEIQVARPFSVGCWRV